MFYRDSGGDGPVMVHVHGFAISGSYLLPTATRLAARYRVIVPDLPGYGRSEDPPRTLDIPGLADALVSFLDALDVDRPILLGNSMGCPIICEVEHRHRERVDRTVLVSPAGGLHNQPLLRAISQLATDGLREPPAMARVAVPDYLRFGPVNAARLFLALTRYPTPDRFRAMRRPSLAVLGSRDPLLPGRPEIERRVRLLDDHLTVAVIVGAAHAVNFSHPGELAHVVDAWLTGAPIADDPHQPGFARVVRVGRQART